jgi:hypothetical protein
LAFLTAKQRDNRADFFFTRSQVTAVMLVNLFSFMRLNHSVFQGLLDNLIDLSACCCSSWHE